MAKNKEELQNLLKKVKEESEKVGLNSTFKKLRSWHLIPSLHGKSIQKKWKQWQILVSWAPKSLWTVTAAMKLKDAPWKKSYDKPRQHIKKQRHHFTNKGLDSQKYGFSSSHVWMWVLKVKKAEHRRFDGFELCCWRRLLRVPWTARRSFRIDWFDINTEYSLEGLMLKLQNFDHLTRRANSLEKTQRARWKGQQRARLDGITDSMDMRLSKVQEMVKDSKAWCAAVHGVTGSWTRPDDSTTVPHAF